MANSIYRHNRACFNLSWLIVAVCVSSASFFARNDLTVSSRQSLATPLNEAPQAETKKTVPVKDLVELYKKHYPNTKVNDVRSPLDYIFKNLGVGQGFLISNSSYYKLRFRYACEKLLSGGMAPSFENYFGSSFGRPNQVPDGHVDVYTAEVIRELIESDTYDKKPIIIKAAQAAIKDMGAQIGRGSKDIVFAMPFDIALYEREIWDSANSRITINESYQIAGRINAILNSLPKKQRRA